MVAFVNVHEAKTHLSRLLQQVEAGERVVISRAGTPVAELVRYEKPPLRPGLLKGQIEYDSDTFDDPDPEIMRMVYGDDPDDPLAEYMTEDLGGDGVENTAES